MKGFARSAATVSAFTAAGLALGFLANLVTAARFGVGKDMDAYLAATTLPSLLILVLATSLGATFVPLFSTLREKEPAEAGRVLGTLTMLVGGMGLALALAAMAFPDALIRAATPGLDAGTERQAAALLRWLLPTIALASVNEIFTGANYCAGRFAIPAAGRLLAPSFTIAAILLLGERLGVTSLALATLSALATQTVLLATVLVRSGGLRDGLRPAWRHPAVFGFLRVAAPLAFAMCFYKLRPVFERWLASGMEPGSISLLGYASRLIQSLQPILVSGIAVTGFALMSGLIAKGDLAGLRAALLRSANALFFASVPLAALFWGFAEPVIGLVFERGAFTRNDTVETARLFALYALALPAGAVGTVVGQAFYSFRDTRTPILAGFLDLALFVALSLLLVPRLGLSALPAGYLLSLYATSLLITWLLVRKTGFSVLSAFAPPFAKSMASALAALGLALLLERGAAVFLPSSYALSVACMGAGALAYLGLQHVGFRSPETARLLRALRRSG